jgi:hypothetical protein
VVGDEHMVASDQVLEAGRRRHAFTLSRCRSEVATLS